MCVDKMLPCMNESLHLTWCPDKPTTVIFHHKWQHALVSWYWVHDYMFGFIKSIYFLTVTSHEHHGNSNHVTLNDSIGWHSFFMNCWGLSSHQFHFNHVEIYRYNSSGIESYIYIYWTEFIFKTKLKLESGNQKIQYGCQAAILKLTSLKINRLLPIYIRTVPLKF